MITAGGGMLIKGKSVDDDAARDFYRDALGSDFCDVGRVDISLMDSAGIARLGTAYICVHSNDGELASGLSEVILAALESWAESANAKSC